MFGYCIVGMSINKIGPVSDPYRNHYEIIKIDEIDNEKIATLRPTTTKKLLKIPLSVINDQQWVDLDHSIADELDDEESLTYFDVHDDDDDDDDNDDDFSGGKRKSRSRRRTKTRRGRRVKTRRIRRRR